MEHLIKLLRDSYDLQEQESEKSAYWHLQQLRSEIKQLTLTDVVGTCCDETRKINQFLQRPSKYCMTCSKEMK